MEIRRFFISLNNFVPQITEYIPADHLFFAGKFLYYASDNRVTLLVADMKSVATHTNIVTACEVGECAIDGQLAGAGKVVSGHVSSWSSWGFNYETPEELRPDIIELLGIIDPS